MEIWRRAAQKVPIANLLAVEQHVDDRAGLDVVRVLKDELQGSLGATQEREQLGVFMLSVSGLPGMSCNEIKQSLLRPMHILPPFPFPPTK